MVHSILRQELEVCRGPIGLAASVGLEHSHSQVGSLAHSRASHPETAQ